MNNTKNLSGLAGVIRRTVALERDPTACPGFRLVVPCGLPVDGRPLCDACEHEHAEFVISDAASAYEKRGG